MFSDKPKLIFHGGVGTATGAIIELQSGGKRILIDCGLLQGNRQAEDKNFEPFGFRPDEIDFVLITHAHMDHIGRVPKLVSEGFNGRIISTNATKELAEPMLHDAVNVISERHDGRGLFDKSDVERAMNKWEGRSYGERIELFSGCALEMQNAGHILGSAILNVEIIPPAPKEGKKSAIKIAFTGDLGNSPSPLLPDCENVQRADYMVMESVYGDRNHKNKATRREALKNAILKGIKRGGTMVISAFSVERTQVLLYEINNMVEDGEIPKVPVFLDSPLALKITGIYKKYSSDFNKAVKDEVKSGDDIFNFPNLKVVNSPDESEEIEKVSGPKIIIAGSGMSEGGRVVNHEFKILGREENTLMLVGYQAPGTMGRMLEEGAKEVIPPAPFYAKKERISEPSKAREKIKVRAKIEKIEGYSSHMDSEHLLEFVEKATSPGLRLGLSLTQEGQGNQTDSDHKLKRVFVIMGEPKSSLFLCQRIRDYLDVEGVFPEVGKAYEL